MKYCGQCGMELKDDAKFCANCGEKCPENKIKMPAVSAQQKKQRNPKHSLMTGICSIKKAFRGLLLLTLVVAIFVGCQLIHSYMQVKAAYDIYEIITQNMGKRIESYLVDGMVAVEDLDPVLEEINQYARELYTQGDITDYSYRQGDSCVYMEIDGWLGMIYEVPMKDFLSGSADGISIVTVEPYASDFGVWANYVMSGANGPDEAAELMESAFSKFSFSVDLEDREVTVESVKNWPSHSIIIWMGHGGHCSRLDNPAFSGSYIAVRDDGTDPQILYQYREEIESGAIYVSSSGTLNLTPVFFEQYMPSNALEGSLVYISACYSAADSKLAQSILNNGAIAYLGNTTLTTQGYGFKMPYAFFEALTPPQDGGYIMSVTEALKYAKEKHGASDWYANSQVGIAALYDFTLPEMIPLMGEVYDVSTDFVLSVYGENKSLCENYSLYITQARALNECYLNYGKNVEIDDVITHCMDYRVVTTADDVQIRLTPGIYELAIVDNTDIEKTQIITIQVLEETGSNTLSIDTDFGPKMIDTQLELPTNPQTITKEERLAYVETYEDGEKCNEYHFTYNDLGQVVGLEAYRYNDETPTKWYTEKYEYDDAGNIILTESVFSRGSSQSYHYQYDYDSNGKIMGYSYIEYYEDVTGPSDYYTLSYDNQGRCIKEQGKYSLSVVKYSYDESSRPSYSLHEYDHCDAHFADSATYDYSYAPLIISSYSSISNSEVYGNHSGKSIAFMPRWNLGLASWNIDDSCTFDVNSDGNLLRVVDENGSNVYVCHYEETSDDSNQSEVPSSNNQAWAAAYIPVVEKALAKANKCTGGGRYGILTNMDEDTTPELILSYPVMEKGSRWIWYYAFSVYDYENGSLTTIMEDESVGASEAAAGGGGGTSVVLYRNTPMIIAYRTLGETSASDGEYVERNCEAFLYSFGSTTPTQTFSAKAGKNEITYSLNSQKVSESDFLEEIRNYAYLTYDNEWWISFNLDYPVTGLYALLGNLQKTANLSPSSKTLISNDDAESIAYLYWNEEVSQDDEYKIIQAENIIAEGVMYYHFELHINYVADKWAAYQTVFIDSVTGNCVSSLF